MLTLSTKTLAFSVLAVRVKGDSECLIEILLAETRKLSSYPGKIVFSLLLNAEKNFNTEAYHRGPPDDGMDNIYDNLT